MPKNSTPKPQKKAPKRKALTKKTRFEVFKRDGFQCAYCGDCPPAVVLEIDHIEPVSKGGDNSIENLITSCFDCNRGKRDIPLDKIPSKLTDNLEVLKEKEAQIKEFRKFIRKIKKRENKDIEDVAGIYSEYFEEYQLTDKFKTVSIRKFIAKLPKHEVEEAMEKACAQIDDSDNSIKYFCGICWTKIKNREGR